MNENKMAQYFTYLDFLRESGVTNMFGAVPYIVKEFGVTRIEAADILTEWMLSKEKASMAQK
jgi:hypothetical protein